MFKRLAFFIILVTLLGCKKENQYKPKPPTPNENFIQLQNNQFVYKNEPFFPIMLNYVACIRKCEGQYVISPTKEYDDHDTWEGNSPDTIHHVLKGHLTLIKELGFNSIRLAFRTGIERFQPNPVITYYEQDKEHHLPLKGNENIPILCIDQFLRLADTIGLKVMLLTEPPIQNPDIENYTLQVLQRFKDNPTLFVYDFFNEPLYFDNSHLPHDKRVRSKEEIYDIVLRWNQLMREHAPYQLFTIGFSEPIEVFEWDASILPVDFVQIHSYHPLRFPNEVSWYCDYIHKPIMIGETSLPADNDSISYEEQRQFMWDAFRYARNKGCIGFGWWQFQEVKWGTYEHNYTALINHEGITYTQDKTFLIKGSLKPAALEVKKLLHYTPQPSSRSKWVNYYNMLGYRNIVLKGKILDPETQKPIEGAVLRGWTQWWDVAANTYSDSLGNFTLYSNQEFTHFELSAPGRERQKFDYRAHYTPAVPNPIPWEKLPDTQLEYHQISYQPFLKKDTLNAQYKTFHFDPAKFHQAQYQGTMPPLYLKKIHIE